MSNNLLRNVLNHDVYILGVYDEKTKKHYNVHIQSCCPPNGPLAGFICYAFYITTSDPYCDVLVGFGRKAFAPEEYDSEKDMMDELAALLEEKLPDGIRRFEAIMATGINGNRLEF